MKGLKAAGSHDAAVAERMGMSLVNKILPQWDALTPFERSILRSVFPFYTWTQHILRYVYNLPLDHPYRVAVTASLIRNEMADEDTGWPQLFRNMVLLGDDDDKKTAVKLGGGNPFGDVWSMASLSGFMRQANPLLATAANTLGIGKSGQADLFPDRNYDPTTGRLVVDTGNPLMDMVHNTVPQVASIEAMLAGMGKFDADWTKDPKAMRDKVLSGFGIPLYWEGISVGEEAAKQDQLMFEQKEQDLSQGLRTGDYQEIDKWPDNHEVLAQVHQAQVTRSPWARKYSPQVLLDAQQEAIRQQR
jgi:hypothetical protein